MASPYSAQQTNQEQKAAQAENNARFATFASTHVTEGNGYFVDKTAVHFGCSFVYEPIITHGIAIVKAPDTKHYQYPVANAGVYKWILKQNPADSGKSKNDPTTSPFYTGCYVYFSVKIDPLVYPRTDGSNLHDLQTQLQEAKPGTQVYQALTANIAEAKEALYLKAHPAKCTLVHTLSFGQMATKDITDSVTQQLNNDPTLTPNQPLYGNT